MVNFKMSTTTYGHLEPQLTFDCGEVADEELIVQEVFDMMFEDGNEALSNRPTATASDIETLLYQNQESDLNTSPTNSDTTSVAYYDATTTLHDLSPQYNVDSSVDASPQTDPGLGYAPPSVITSKQDFIDSSQSFYISEARKGCADMISRSKTVNKIAAQVPNSVDNPLTPELAADVLTAQPTSSLLNNHLIAQSIDTILLNSDVNATVDGFTSAPKQIGSTQFNTKRNQSARPNIDNTRLSAISRNSSDAISNAAIFSSCENVTNPTKLTNKSTMSSSLVSSPESDSSIWIKNLLRNNISVNLSPLSARPSVNKNTNTVDSILSLIAQTESECSTPLSLNKPDPLDPAERSSQRGSLARGSLAQGSSVRGLSNRGSSYRSTSVDESVSSSDGISPSPVSNTDRFSHPSESEMDEEDCISSCVQSSPEQQAALVLTDEEKSLLLREGIVLPTNMPLTKMEQRALRTVRRKIRNKLSAKESRKRKQSYVDGLEKRIRLCTQRNTELEQRLEAVERQNSTMLTQLRRIKTALVAASQQHASTPACLCVLLLSFAFVALPHTSLFDATSPNSVARHSGDSGASRSLLRMRLDEPMDTRPESTLGAASQNEFSQLERRSTEAYDVEYELSESGSISEESYQETESYKVNSGKSLTKTTNHDRQADNAIEPQLTENATDSKNADTVTNVGQTNVIQNSSLHDTALLSKEHMVQDFYSSASDKKTNSNEDSYKPEVEDGSRQKIEDTHTFVGRKTSMVNEEL